MGSDYQIVYLPIPFISIARETITPKWCQGLRRQSYCRHTFGPRIRMTSVNTSSFAISMEMSQLIDAEWSSGKGSSCRQMPSQSWSTEQSRCLLFPAACSQRVLAAGQPWQHCWIILGRRKDSRPYCHPWGTWRLGRDGAEAETEACMVCGLHRFEARWSFCMLEFIDIFIYKKTHLDIYLLNKYSLNTQRPFS